MLHTNTFSSLNMVLRFANTTKYHEVEGKEVIAVKISDLYWYFRKIAGGAYVLVMTYTKLISE